MDVIRKLGYLSLRWVEHLNYNSICLFYGYSPVLLHGCFLSVRDRWFEFIKRKERFYERYFTG
jgi:hypothetical protein